MAVKVTPKKTEKQKNDLPLKTFYNHWDWHVGMLEDLEKLNRYLKGCPVGIYEKSPGKYFLIAKGLGEIYCFGGGIGHIFLECFNLRGKYFGTRLLSGHENPEYFIGDLIQSPDEFLDKVGMAVEYLDETDPFYQLEVERLMMVGSIVSSLPVWGIGGVKEFFWRIGFLNSQNVNDDYANDLLTVLEDGPGSISNDAYRKLCSVCSRLEPARSVVTASSAFSDVRVFGDLAHIRSGTINRTVYA